MLPMKPNIQVLLKQGIILFSLFFAGHLAFAQQTSGSREIKPDAHLYECFPKDYVDGLKDNPRLLLYYNFYLDNAFFVSDAKGKARRDQILSWSAIKNPGRTVKPGISTKTLLILIQRNLMP